MTNHKQQPIGRKQQQETESEVKGLKPRDDLDAKDRLLLSCLPVELCFVLCCQRS